MAVTKYLRWLTAPVCAAALLVSGSLSAGGAAVSSGDGGVDRDPRYSDAPSSWYGAGRADPLGGVFVDLAVSQESSCGVRDSGELACWGDRWGVVPKGRFTKLSLSGGHGCALAVDGSVQCWGTNDMGQLDAPEGMFREVSASGSTSCAVTAEGSVRCWGDGGDLAVPPGKFIKVFAGALCGLRTDGEYVCWGPDDRDGPLLDAPAGEFEALVLELGYACALSADGEVSCWGSGSAIWGDPPPSAASGPFAAVSLGYGHGCALAVDGSVQCWGDNRSGQAEPRQGPFVQVTAGREFTCGLDTVGEVQCWGHGLNADSRARAQPLSRISAGEGSLCGISASDGTVACWLQYRGGARIEDGPKGGGFVDVDAGSQHACALRADGQAICWGYRTDRLSGLLAVVSEPRYRALAVGYRAACGSRTDGTSHCWMPDWLPPGPGGQFKHVAAGPCGIRPTGSIECWGFTRHVGEPPHTIGPLSDADIGFRISCGIQTPSATIACWDPDTNHQLLAIEGSYTYISTTRYRICALTLDGALRCWFWTAGPTARLCEPGASCWNRQGEQSFDMPQGTFTKIAAANDHACAIRTDGTVACWGSNYDNSGWQPRVDPSADGTDRGALTSRWWLAVQVLVGVVAAAAGAAVINAKRRKRHHPGNDLGEPDTAIALEDTKRVLAELIGPDDQAGADPENDKTR